MTDHQKDLAMKTIWKPLVNISMQGVTAKVILAGDQSEINPRMDTSHMCQLQSG
jgi:hypothetical protein